MQVMPRGTTPASKRFEVLGNEQHEVKPYIRKVFHGNLPEIRQIPVDIRAGQNFRFHEQVFLMNQIQDPAVL